MKRPRLVTIFWEPTGGLAGGEIQHYNGRITTTSHHASAYRLFEYLRSHNVAVSYIKSTNYDCYVFAA
jgi:phage replication-related protein YjqB (UPF0714/DUF867 family)